MARKSKTTDKANGRDRKKAKIAKKTSARIEAIGPGSGTWKDNPALRPLVTIGQIIANFFDVATLLLRMLVYTLIYDTPHGKHEMMLSPESRDAKQ